MPSTRDIRRRIVSVKKTAQITTAGQVNDEVKANLKAALDEYKSANK